jgi:hypothetical protein
MASWNATAVFRVFAAADAGGEAREAASTTVPAATIRQTFLRAPVDTGFSFLHTRG